MRAMYQPHSWLLPRASTVRRWRWYWAAGAVGSGLAIYAFGIWLSPTTCNGCSPFALDAARSFREQPWRWRADRFYATRDDGLELWVANGPSNLAAVGLSGYNEDWTSLNFPYGSWEQRYVWTAFEDWKRETWKPPEAWPASRKP